MLRKKKDNQSTLLNFSQIVVNNQKIREDAMAKKNENEENLASDIRVRSIF